MEYTPEISSALDIYSEETVSPDETGSVLHIYSENAKIQSSCFSWDLCANYVIDAINNVIQFKITQQDSYQEKNYQI